MGLMAISDWTSVVQGNFVFLLETGDPIAGTGSLRLERNSGSGNEGAIIYPIGLPTGITKGRLQSKFRLDDMTTDNGSDQRVGMFFMVDSLGSPLTSSAMYAFVAVVRTTGITKFEVHKLSSGVQSMGVGTIKQSFVLGSPIAIDADVTMQVDWIYEPIQFSGTNIIARYKEGTDFTSMIEIFDFVDTTSPLTTSVAEGLGGSTATGPQDFVVFWDDTSLFTLIPA
jgi:hypothetical protein